MKNLKLSASIIALALVFATACDKDETNPVAENGSATISGTAFVDLTELNDTNSVVDWNYEYVPEGTILYAKVNSEDLVLIPNGSATYADLYYETTVGASGAYSFTVPANSKSFSVSITADDFTANFTEAGADTIVYQKYFSLSEVSVGGVHDGAIRLMNLYFQ